MPPWGALGSRRARKGWSANRPLPDVGAVQHGEHGKRRSAGAGRGSGGRGSPRTQSRCWRGGADGAEESEDGHAVPRGPLPLGAGPEPSERLAQRSPANAQAVHGGIPGELAQCAGTLCGEGEPQRTTEGVEPCAGKAARTVRNGGEEETGQKALRLVPPQP